jgi:hypothetical protein
MPMVWLYHHPVGAGCEVDANEFPKSSPARRPFLLERISFFSVGFAHQRRAMYLARELLSSPSSVRANYCDLPTLFLSNPC